MTGHRGELDPATRARMEARRVERMTWGTYDHTAPYACTLPNCQKCAGKPSYHDWWLTVDARLRKERGQPPRRPDGR